MIYSMAKVGAGKAGPLHAANIANVQAIIIAALTHCRNEENDEQEITARTY